MMRELRGDVKEGEGCGRLTNAERRKLGDHKTLLQIVGLSMEREQLRFRSIQKSGKPPGNEQSVPEVSSPLLHSTFPVHEACITTGSASLYDQYKSSTFETCTLEWLLEAPLSSRTLLFGPSS